jgi:hypothetical protein
MPVNTEIVFVSQDMTLAESVNKERSHTKRYNGLVSHASNENREGPGGTKKVNLRPGALYQRGCSD